MNQGYEDLICRFIVNGEHCGSRRKKNDCIFTSGNDCLCVRDFEVRFISDNEETLSLSDLIALSDDAKLELCIYSHGDFAVKYVSDEEYFEIPRNKGKGAIFISYFDRNSTFTTLCIGRLSFAQVRNICTLSKNIEQTEYFRQVIQETLEREIRHLKERKIV